jgi:dynein heavy chain
MCVARSTGVGDVWLPTQGLDGALNMSEAMEGLALALAAGEVPGRLAAHRCDWERLAWPSRKVCEYWR